MKHKFIVRTKLFVASIIIATFFILFLKMHNIDRSNNYSTFDKLSMCLFDKNKYECVVTGLDINKVEIFWQVENTEIERVIYKQSKFRNEIEYAYGKNYFLINYDGKLRFKLNQFKTNKWNNHKYIFNISKSNNLIILSFDAIGVDLVSIKDTTSFIY